ncbi:MAG TPA: hypothetical protein VES19_12425 [Candidatus Limnocylindrales bacterium]|nr:hypothetical protein [Candidatus Limnocylindrales bacterium]
MTAPGVPPVNGSTAAIEAAPGVVSLRAAIAEGRLTLGGLATTVRVSAVVALGLVLVACLAILAAALSVPLPGGIHLVPGTLVGEDAPVSVSNLAVAGFLVGLAPASAVLVASALVIPRRSSRAVVLAVAGVTLSIGAPVLAQLPLAWAIAAADPRGPWLVAAGGGGAVAASLLLALGGVLLPGDGLTRPASRLVVLLAAAPGVLLAATYLLGLLGSASMPSPRPSGMETFPDVVHIAATAVAGPLYGALARLLPLVLAPIVLWEAATWARASRAELAAPIVRRVDGLPWLLVGLVVAKLGWLALGYAGQLPASIGGEAEAWGVSAAKGPLAWLIAGAFATGAAVWLMHRSSPAIVERDVRPGMWFVVGGFSAGSVVGGACVVLAGILLLLPVEGPFLATIRLGSLAADLIAPVQVATVPAALLAGLVLLRRGHASPGGFLAIAGAWMAPRALFVVAEATGLVPPGAANPLGVDLATLDTLITVAVAALAAVLVAGHRTGADAGTLALVLAVSTLMAHGATLVPTAVVPVLVLAAVLFPPFRELVFGSHELNKPSPVRPARVLGSLGRLGAVLLVVAGTRTIVGNPEQGGAMGQLGQLLFGPPYAALLVAAVITVRRRRPGAIEVAEGALVVPEPEPEPHADVVPEPARGVVAQRGVAAERGVATEPAPDAAPRPAPGRPIARPVLGLAAGIAGLAIATALAGLVVDPLVGRAWTPMPTPAPGPSATPSPAADDAALLEALVPEVNARMTALQALVTEHVGGASEAELAAVGDELSAAATDDIAWLMAQPVRACFMPYRDAMARHLAAYRDFGAAVASVGRGTGSDAEINRLVDEVAASLDLVLDRLGAALPACGVTGASPSAVP